MGKSFDLHEMERQVRQIRWKMEEQIALADEILSEIKSFEDDDELQSQAFDNLKERMGKVHGSIWRGVKLCSQSIINANNTLITWYQNQVNLEYIDTDIVQQTKYTLEMHMRFLSNESILSGTIIDPAYYGYQNYVNQLEQHLENFDYYEYDTSTLLDEANRYLDLIDIGIDQLNDDDWDDLTGMFKTTKSVDWSNEIDTKYSYNNLKFAGVTESAIDYAISIGYDYQMLSDIYDTLSSDVDREAFVLLLNNNFEEVFSIDYNLLDANTIFFMQDYVTKVGIHDVLNDPELKNLSKIMNSLSLVEDNYLESSQYKYLLSFSALLLNELQLEIWNEYGSEKFSEETEKSLKIKEDLFYLIATVLYFNTDFKGKPSLINLDANHEGYDAYKKEWFNGMRIDGLKYQGGKLEFEGVYYKSAEIKLFGKTNEHKVSNDKIKIGSVKSNSDYSKGTSDFMTTMNEIEKERQKIINYLLMDLGVVSVGIWNPLLAATLKLTVETIKVNDQGKIPKFIVGKSKTEFEKWRKGLDGRTKIGKFWKGKNIYHSRGAIALFDTFSSGIDFVSAMEGLRKKEKKALLDYYDLFYDESQTRLEVDGEFVYVLKGMRIPSYRLVVAYGQCTTKGLVNMSFKNPILQREIQNLANDLELISSIDSEFDKEVADAIKSILFGPPSYQDENGIMVKSKGYDFTRVGTEDEGIYSMKSHDKIMTEINWIIELFNI